MNIVLTGFMGTGKTTVGRRVAEDLHVPFLDVDSAIEKEFGRSIRTIFETDGEAHFRQLESKTIKQLAAHDNVVIATGGGALLYTENRSVLKKNGYLVCLTARVGTLLERLKDDLSRPLLTGDDPASRMEQLLVERKGIYAVCDLQVHTDDRTIAEVANIIIEAVGSRWRKPA